MIESREHKKARHKGYSLVIWTNSSKVECFCISKREQGDIVHKGEYNGSREGALEFVGQLIYGLPDVDKRRRCSGRYRTKALERFLFREVYKTTKTKRR